MAEHPDYYAVAFGRKPGIYRQWTEAHEQVNGYKNNCHERFGTEEEAIKFMLPYHKRGDIRFFYPRTEDSLDEKLAQLSIKGDSKDATITRRLDNLEDRVSRLEKKR